MKRSFIASALVLASAACGGTSTGATGPGARSPIPIGIHGCHFVVGGETYGQHRCDVVAGDAVQLDKRSGMETFTGTLEVVGDVLRLSADLACGAVAEQCGQSFSVDLKKEGKAWKGQVVPAAAVETEGASAGEWWLAGSTFEIDAAAGYGGETYGAGVAGP